MRSLKQEIISTAAILSIGLLALFLGPATMEYIIAVVLVVISALVSILLVAIHQSVLSLISLRKILNSHEAELTAIKQKLTAMDSLTRDTKVLINEINAVIQKARAESSPQLREVLSQGREEHRTSLKKFEDASLQLSLQQREVLAKVMRGRDENRSYYNGLMTRIRDQYRKTYSTLDKIFHQIGGIEDQIAGLRNQSARETKTVLDGYDARDVEVKQLLTAVGGIRALSVELLAINDARLEAEDRA